MRSLTVLYDPDCGLCGRVAAWLATQPKWIPLRVLPSTMAARLHPELEAMKPGEELIAVSDEGGIYRGDHAWLTCLYALKRYRSLARRLSRPALLPFARQAFKFVSSNRRGISSWLEMLNDTEIEAELRQIPAPRCHGTST